MYLVSLVYLTNNEDYILFAFQIVEILLPAEKDVDLDCYVSDNTSE